MTRIAIAAAVVLSALAARAEEAAPERTAQILGIEEYRMPNGLRVVLFPDPNKPKVTVNLTVLVGSVHEGAGEMGMAHVFEHVLFHAVEGIPDIAGKLKELGADYNGTTWFDRTNFFETVSATDENLEFAIRLEAGRLGGAILNADDLEKEGKIVESEFDIGSSNPSRLVVMGMFGAMYDFHAYSREPIGTIEDFKSLRIENILPFYKKYYRPDNAVLFVTGKFETATALELVNKHFGPLKGSGENRPGYTTREPASSGERRYTVRKPGEAHVILAGYRIPGSSHPDAAIADVFAQMLVSGNSGPLHDAVVAKGLAGSVSASTISLRYASPFFVMATVPKDKDADACEAAILNLIENKAASLDEDDLERAQSEMEKGFDDLFNNPQSLAFALSEAESWGSWKLLLARREQTKGVTIEEVHAFAAKYIRLENRVVGRFMPDSEAVGVKLETEPAPSKYDMLLSKLPAMSKKVKVFDYSSANVMSKLQWLDVGPVKVGLVRKETVGDRVHLQFTVPLAGRKIVYPTAVAGEALSELITEKTATLSKDELKSKLAGMMTEIGLGISIEGASISISTTKASLPEALKLAREMLRSPLIDEASLQEYVRRTKDQIKASRDEPQVLLQQTVPTMILAQGDPRLPRTFDEVIAELDKLTVEAVLAFHKEFLGADGMVGGIVGDVDPKDVDALLKPIVGDWKAAKPGVQETNEAVEKLLKNEARLETPGKPSAISVMIQPIRLSIASADYSAIQAASSALFQDGMASRIPNKVRVEKALSYATGGMVIADLKGDFGMVLLYTMTKPENAGKALDLIRTELVEALKTGVTEEELATFKKGYANQVSQARADDARLAGTIVTLKVAGKDFTLWNKLDEASANLTLEDVNAALRKYVDPSKMGTIQVGDFEGKKKKKGKE
ncbi:MAG: pitrilysin family protein [Planctomycetota bacterium]